MEIRPALRISDSQKKAIVDKHNDSLKVWHTMHPHANEPRTREKSAKEIGISLKEWYQAPAAETGRSAILASGMRFKISNVRKMDVNRKLAIKPKKAPVRHVPFLRFVKDWNGYTCPTPAPAADCTRRIYGRVEGLAYIATKAETPKKYHVHGAMIDEKSLYRLAISLTYKKAVRIAGLVKAGTDSPEKVKKTHNRPFGGSSRYDLIVARVGSVRIMDNGLLSGDIEGCGYVQTAAGVLAERFGGFVTRETLRKVYAAVGSEIMRNVRGAGAEKSRLETFLTKAEKAVDNDNETEEMISSYSEKYQLTEIQKNLLSVLVSVNGNISRAAEILGVSRAAVQHNLKRIQHKVSI